MTYKANMKSTKMIPFSSLFSRFSTFCINTGLRNFFACLLRQSTERQGVIPFIYWLAAASSNMCGQTEAEAKILNIYEACQCNFLRVSWLL